MKERAYTVIANVMNVPADSVNDNSSPDNIEQWDSIKHMNLVLALEQEFSVQFDDEQVADMLSAELVVETLREVDVT
ncbi:MAG: acyl carrier protein [Pseudodesulfovibrio sp.]|nr:acyl carrier protein [Pseudodesulfovibrio sp.]